MAQARMEKKQAQIRAAARALFLRSGFQGTSTDAIAAAAGVSKETLYRYYPRKEDLFMDVVRSLTTERLDLTQRTERYPEPASIEDLRGHLRAIAQEVLEVMTQPEYQAIARLILAEVSRFPELGPLFRQTVSEPVKSALLALLRQGQARGVVRQHIDLSVIARMFFSTLMGYGVLDGLMTNTPAPNMPEASVIDTFVEHIVEMVMVKDHE